MMEALVCLAGELSYGQTILEFRPTPGGGGGAGGADGGGRAKVSKQVSVVRRVWSVRYTGRCPRGRYVQSRPDLCTISLVGVFALSQFQQL